MIHRPDRLIPLNHPHDGRLGWSAALAGSLAVFVIALSVMLVMRAGWLDHALSLSPSASAHWLPAALAAGVLLGGISLLWLVLARFAREVEKAPYVWLAPVMTALPSIAIVAWGLTPPSGLPGRLFAVAWVPLLIGGGSLFRLFGLGRKLLGTLLWALPALWVLTDAAVKGQGSIAHGWDRLPREGQMFAAVVTLTCVGVGLLAFLTRDRGLDMRSIREERRQLAQERMSIAEERATLAGERQGLDGLVARAEAALSGGHLPLDAHDLAAMTSKKRPLWPLALVPFLLAGAVLAFEFGHRRPMLEQTMAMESIQARHQQEVASLRSQLGTDHTDALSALEAERDKAVKERKELTAELDELRRANTAALDRVEAQATADAKAREAAAAPKAKATPKKASPTAKGKKSAVAAKREAAKHKRAAAPKHDRKPKSQRNAARSVKRSKPARAAKSAGAFSDDSDDPLLGIDLK